MEPNPTESNAPSSSQTPQVAAGAMPQRDGDEHEAGCREPLGASTDNAASSDQQPELVSSLSIDVAAIMNSLSDLGKDIPPADRIHVASFIPPRENEPISSFYNVVDTSHVWGQLPVPEDIARLSKELLQLRSRQCVQDPQMQSIFQAVASLLGSGRHLLPQEQRSLLFDAVGNVADPKVLFEWITREEVRCREDLTGRADRTLPLPVYDSNHGFHESDIEAYTNNALLEETWGKPPLATSEEWLEGSEKQPSVHARGGLTWMQRALVDRAPFETLAEFFPYRERMTSASGKCSAARTRTEIASYPRTGGAERCGFVDAVKHRAGSAQRVHDAAAAQGANGPA